MRAGRIKIRPARIMTFDVVLFLRRKSADYHISATHLGIRKTRFSVKFAVRQNGKKRGINVGYFAFIRNVFVSAEVDFHFDVLVKAFFDSLFDRSYTRTRFYHTRIIAGFAIFKPRKRRVPRRTKKFLKHFSAFVTTKVYYLFAFCDFFYKIYHPFNMLLVEVNERIVHYKKGLFGFECVFNKT